MIDEEILGIEEVMEMTIDEWKKMHKRVGWYASAIMLIIITFSIFMATSIMPVQAQIEIPGLGGDWEGGIGSAGDTVTGFIDNAEAAINSILSGNIDSNALLFIAIGCSIGFMVTIITTERAKIASGRHG